MKLRCAEVLHTLGHKPIVMNMPPYGEPREAGQSDRARQAVVKPLLPLIHQAQKYIFDSGMDRDPETTQAVRDTALAMQEAGLFRLPHPVMWIEDPFEGDKQECHFYLVIERERTIDLWFMMFADTEMVQKIIGGKRMPSLQMYPFSIRIDLDDPMDLFTAWRDGKQVAIVDRTVGAKLGEAMYAFKKLIVTLNTKNLSTERVRTDPRETKRHWNGDSRTRPYDHTIIRVPVDAGDDAAGREKAKREGVPYNPRRSTLVAGYMWGKHTRPRAEQRWIFPHWRGDVTTETFERSYYEVRR